MWFVGLYSVGEGATFSRLGHVVCCPSLGARLNPVFIHRFSRMAPHVGPNGAARPALCAFGSPDPEGFTPDMGCELAAFLTRVVERMAERWPILN